MHYIYIYDYMRHVPVVLVTLALILYRSGIIIIISSSSGIIMCSSCVSIIYCVACVCVYIYIYRERGRYN